MYSINAVYIYTGVLHSWIIAQHYCTVKSVLHSWNINYKYIYEAADRGEVQRASLLTQSVWHSEGGVEKFDGDRQEWLPVALCGASRWNESCSECTPVLDQHIMEWVVEIVKDDT